jgi:hypothetical protein
MKPDDPRHGTRAGAVAHRKDGEKPCAPCRQGEAAYMRELRKRPDIRENEHRKNNARARALWRLAALHRDEFERLYLIELGPPVMALTADPSG